jgi:hypothetical protein
VSFTNQSTSLHGSNDGPFDPWRPVRAHVYRLGTFSLGPGTSVVVRTGKGTNRATTGYWGSSAYVWNNTGRPGDRATLKNSASTTVSACTWTSLGIGSTTC